MLARTATCALVVAAAACGEPGGVTVVTIRARPAVKAVERIDVTLANAATTQTERFTIDGRAFPLTFSVETRDRDGDLTISIDAEDTGGATIASGTTTVAIDPGTSTTAEVTIEPHDFGVNTIFLGDQALAFRADSAGRQVAVSPDGIATIGWSDSCAVAGRCDVFGRRFDATGTAVVTAAAAGDGQFTVNQTDGLIGFEPSLATNADGVTLAVWSDGTDLLAVAFDAAGAALTPVETTIAAATQPSTPAVTALPTGRFVVTWTEDGATGGTFAVKARHVEATGLVGINPIAGNTAAYTVSTTAVTARTPPAIVALGDAGAHAIVWRVDTAVRGRFYNPAGQPRTATDQVLAGYAPTDSLGEPLVTRVEGDIVIAFARRTAPGGDADTGQVVLRRLTPMIQRVGVDGLATRDVGLRPVALTARPDGAIAAAWEACMADGDGAGCGVRMQVFRPTLAPVGPSRLINTTTANNQLEPSLAPLPDGAFIAAWSDGSGVAPDRDGFGIRARILYPPYDDARGVLGARCTATAECGADAVCMPGSDDQPRCYRTCTAGACPSGGTCTTLGTESGCLF